MSKLRRENYIEHRWIVVTMVVACSLALWSFGDARVCAASNEADGIKIANQLTLSRLSNWSNSPNPGNEATNTVVLTPLSSREQNELLAKRLNGGFAYSFGQFANMFVVSSVLQLGWTVGLVTSSKEIESTELRPVFPASYKPTLHEFLDAIGSETKSNWQYDPTSNFIRSDVKSTKPIEKVAMFEFKEASSKLPYAIDMAKGWTAIDHGNWIMYVPPTAPVGMDIYRMGSYSSDDQSKEKELLATIPSDLALEWAHRIKPESKQNDLKTANVGSYEAVYFETKLQSKDGRELQWRHWCFMVGNRCFLIVSAVFNDSATPVFPDVQAMLKSFRPLSD